MQQGGSPDYGGRIRLVGDPGSGCSNDPYRQFNTAAFQGPLVGSDGLESGNSYLKGCFISTLDLAIARNIRLGGARNLHLRVDMLNALNEGHHQPNHLDQLREPERSSHRDQAAV